MSTATKAKATFTAGPWRADMHGQNVLACDDQMMICNVRGWGYLTGRGALNLPDDQAIAIQDVNTRLIAAAPQLHAELIKARDTFADLALTLRMLRHDIVASACDIAKESMDAALALVEQP